MPTLAYRIVTHRCPCLVIGALRSGLSLVEPFDRAIELNLTFPSHPSSECILEDTASTDSASEAIDFTK